MCVGVKTGQTDDIKFVLQLTLFLSKCILSSNKYIHASQHNKGLCKKFSIYMTSIKISTIEVQKKTSL